jgi:hypothetical protein
MGIVMPSKAIAYAWKARSNVACVRAVASDKMKRAVELLSELGAAALAPVKLQGRWKRAPVSRRRAATLRKQAIVDGKYGNTSIENGTVQNRYLCRLCACTHCAA